MARATAAEERLIKHSMKHTEQAYMRATFGDRIWRREIRWLIMIGCNDLEIQAVMRSKWPRWSDHGGHGARRLSSLFDRWTNSHNMDEIRSLVQEYDEDELVPMRGI
jgi:hypothetical protein